MGQSTKVFLSVLLVLAIVFTGLAVYTFVSDDMIKAKHFVNGYTIECDKLREEHSEVLQEFEKCSEKLTPSNRSKLKLLGEELDRLSEEIDEQQEKIDESKETVKELKNRGILFAIIAGVAVASVVVFVIWNKKKAQSEETVSVE